jgi:hypothetical protein
MMHQAVTSLIVVYLVGTALGLRFRVFVLIPAGIAVLISSPVVELTWPGMAGWGVAGALAPLAALNAGFAVGVLLRAEAAVWSTRKTAQLFSRPVDPSRPTHHRPEGAGREASSEAMGRAESLKTAATMARGNPAKKGLHR